MYECGRQPTLNAWFSNHILWIAAIMKFDSLVVLFVIYFVFFIIIVVHVRSQIEKKSWHRRPCLSFGNASIFIANDSGSKCVKIKWTQFLAYLCLFSFHRMCEIKCTHLSLAAVIILYGYTFHSIEW